MAILTDKIEIKIDGKAWKNYVFSDIRLVQELLKPAELRFKMSKDSLNENEKEVSFSLSRDLLGQKVEFTLTTLRVDVKRNQNEDNVVFNGIIFDVNATRSTMGTGSVVEVVAYSPDYLLCDSPHCISYENDTLESIVKSTVEPYEIQLENAPMMTESIPYVVQYNETNYDFMKRLAQRYGEWLYYDGKKLVFGKIKKQDCIELHPDFDMINYRYQLDLEHLKAQHAAHNYLDYGNTTHNVNEFTADNMHRLTDICYNKSDEMYKKETFQNLHAVTAETHSLVETEHSAKILGVGKKSQLAVCIGKTSRADLKIGSVLKIKEFFRVGTDFCMHDELLIYKITHSAEVTEKYENEFWAIPANCEYPPYSSNDLYPHNCGTQRAVVMDNIDPESLGRIRVQFLWQKEQNDNNMMTPWIRIAQPHGGDNKGFYFIPEVGEEVMVGFENGNAEKPYVVGTLYQGEQRPGKNWHNDNSNDIKAIRTRNGHTIEIHDEGEDGFIRIYDNDKENYILTFSTDDKLIKLESTGNIELHAASNVIIKAGNNIEMAAGVDINRNAGENITETAGTDITVSAGNDISTDAGNDITVSAGNDMNTSVGNNDSLNVGKSQTVSIGENKEESITEDYTLSAKNIRIEAEDKTQFYSKDHEQKADSSMKFDGGSGLDLYASSIKIN
jgi:Rhs element Vgr protein